MISATHSAKLNEKAQPFRNQRRRNALSCERLKGYVRAPARVEQRSNTLAFAN
jgi:hypothetical protein